MNKNISGKTNITISDKKLRSRVKSSLLLVLLFTSLITALPFLHSTDVNAVKKQADMNLSDQIKSHIYLYSIAKCIRDGSLIDASAAGGFSHIAAENARSSNWFASGTVIDVYVGPYMNNVLGVSEGEDQCGSDSGMISKALSLWGLDPIVVLCNSGFSRQDAFEPGEDPPTVPSCITGGGTGSLYVPDEIGDNKMSRAANKFIEYIASSIGAEVRSPTPAQKYWYYRHTLNESCISGIDTNPPLAETSTGDYAYNRVKWVDLASAPDFKILQDPQDKSSYVGSMKSDKSIKFFVNSSLENKEWTCSFIKGQMNDNAEEFKTWAENNKDEAATLLANTSGGGEDGNKTTTCAIDGVGWIVCPIVRFLAKVADSAYNFLKTSFLNVEPQLFNINSTTYTAWGIMRNFANLAFVIAFLIIIFSQLTGAGISNYGVKKLLPRIIIAAILVNLSYFICQIAVDLSNIVGQSLSDMFINLGDGLPSATVTERAKGFGSGNSWANMAGGILAGSAAGLIIWTQLGALIPIIILAVFALIMVLFILTAREALIVLLVVISPLAFVAYLLPNTEKWYKSWQKMLVGLLMLYPIVALVYGVSGFASTILAGVSTNVMTQITAAAVVVLPLFLIPVILKKSLDGFGSLGQTLNNLGQRGGKATGKAAQGAFENSGLGQYKKYRSEQRALRRGQIQSGSYKGRGGRWNLRNWGSAANKKLNESRVSGKFGNRRSAQGEAMRDEAEMKEITQAQTSLEAKIARGEVADAETAFADAIEKGDTVGIKAAFNVLSETSSGRVKAHKYIDKMESDTTTAGIERVRSLKRHVAKTQPEIDKKDAALGRWSKKFTDTLQDIEVRDVTQTYNIPDAKMASQSLEGLVTAHSGGVLTQVVADRILDDQELAAKLKVHERAFLERLRDHDGKLGAFTDSSGLYHAAYAGTVKTF